MHITTEEAWKDFRSACAFALHELFLVFLFLCPCSIASVSFFAFSHHIACLSQEEFLSRCLPAWVASGVLCDLFCVCRHCLCLVHGWKVEVGSSQFTLSYAVQLATFYTAHWGITFPSAEPPINGTALCSAPCTCGGRFLCHLHPVWIVLHERGSKEGKTHFYKFWRYFYPSVVLGAWLREVEAWWAPWPCTSGARPASLSAWPSWSNSCTFQDFLWRVVCSLLGALIWVLRCMWTSGAREWKAKFEPWKTGVAQFSEIYKEVSTFLI